MVPIRYSTLYLHKSECFISEIVDVKYHDLPKLNLNLSQHPNSMIRMSTKPKLNVHNFPRPPLLERTPRHLVIKWSNIEVLSTKNAYWVLETTHPPTYYIPKADLNPAFKLTAIPGRSSLCEWKGKATYWTITHPETNEEIKGRVWSYESPTKEFTDIKGYLSFYASGVPWECFVDGEKVEPQPGDL